MQPIDRTGARKENSMNLPPRWKTSTATAPASAMPARRFCAEVFPYEFYRLVPAGVTLVITTLAVTEPSRSEVDRPTR